jgi:CheY-like chemotaxis protein
MNSSILLVDDNAVQATTRKAILERTGRPVLVASDGQAAIDLLSGFERSRDIALIVTDHLMPRMNGPELVSVVRERGLAIPIIVLSGHPEAESAYQNLGVVFRLKPFPPDSLIQLTHELLCHRMPRTA